MGRTLAAISLGSLSLCGTAFAAAPGSGTSTSPLTGFLVGGAIVYFSRRVKIGGWLLYFYVQLYISFLISVLFAVIGFKNLSPSAWDTSAHYVWFLLSVVPVEIGMIAEVFLATVLLWKRGEAMLQRVRQVLLALVGASALAFSIDHLQPSEQVNANSALDLMMLINTLVWCAYFYRSKRVQRVFIYQNWVYDEEEPAKQTPQERRYRLKRGLVSAAIVFVVALLLFGVAQEGDKKPDPVFLFLVPGFYAVVAFAIGWVVPVAKKKRLELAGAVMPTSPEA
ncbi:MAG: hypothetical protein JWM91_401 [Rhodospirillales bacterium]|nr:hypothetical protein [Rhodospirillales bacterium]